MCSLKFSPVYSKVTAHCSIELWMFQMLTVNFRTCSFQSVWRYFPWWSLKYPLNSSPRMSVASQWEIPLCLFMLINLPNPLTCIAGASSNSDAESDSKALLTLVSSDCDLFSVDLEIMHLHTQHQDTLPYVFQVHKHTIINWAIYFNWIV